MISLICGIQKNKTNKQNKMKTDSQIQRTNGWLPEERWVDGGGNR